MEASWKRRRSVSLGMNCSTPRSAVSANTFLLWVNPPVRSAQMATTGSSFTISAGDAWRPDRAILPHLHDREIVVPVVGAGVSSIAGVPGGSALAEHLRNHSHEPDLDIGDWSNPEDPRSVAADIANGDPDMSVDALHKLTAARSIPFDQDGPGCKHEDRAVPSSARRARATGPQAALRAHRSDASPLSSSPFHSVGPVSKLESRGHGPAP